ncbi:SPOR domain-containing protein [Zobellella maritima]|uniref:SPOR domain-containing protein n=1 Tax=Zobellella maritima TaxID=2059725 RepID=UPI000E307B3B|nr:SPOR domain-containing protein [Zobellella maritima]
MAKDYVRRSQPRSKRNPRTTGGSKRKAAPQGSKMPWLAVIFALFLAAGLGYLIYLVKGSAERPPADTGQTQAVPATIDPLDQKPVEKWRYIEQLENKEILVDVPEAKENTQPYLMQCGSFRSQSQAEQLKARIAFQGMESQVRRSDGSNGTWYRVILGPYQSKRKAEKDKHQLLRANVNHCAIWFWEG